MSVLGGGIGHLARRFAGSLSTREPDRRLATRVLTPSELALWLSLGSADQRHSSMVAERLLAAHPEAPRTEVAGALLHDIGKLDAGIGTARRVIATLLPLGDRTRRYRDHERLGAAMLRSLGGDGDVVALVAGDPSDARRRIDAADDV